MRLLLIIFTLTFCQCVPVDCEKYYYYSEYHESQLNAGSFSDTPYKIKKVQGKKYTESSGVDLFSTYKRMWPDAIQVHHGCQDTLILTKEDAP